MAGEIAEENLKQRKPRFYRGFYNNYRKEII